MSVPASGYEGTYNCKDSDQMESVYIWIDDRYIEKDYYKEYDCSPIAALNKYI